MSADNALADRVQTWLGVAMTEAKRLVRMTNIKHELRTRGKQWGGERQLLPAGAVERCLADIDAVVTRHAMQMNGSPPRRNQS